MTPLDPARGVQSVYNFWLGLIPQFLGQFAGGVPGTVEGSGEKGTAPLLQGLVFPADQIARATTMTQQFMQSLAQNIAPLLQASGMPALMGSWAAGAVPGFATSSATQAGGDALQKMFSPWTAMMANVATPMTSPTAAAKSSQEPVSAMGQAWMDLATRLPGSVPADYTVAFDRTYGALSDALGLGPLRRLQAAWQDVAQASIAQQEARAQYALLVQRAFAQGLQRMLHKLADKAQAGERIESILALLRLWAVATEDAVHETLQSQTGLAATANLTRAALAYRKKMQHVADIVADMLDMATRRDLDEAFREIQALKRELRSLRHAHGERGWAEPGPPAMDRADRGSSRIADSDDATGNDATPASARRGAGRASRRKSA